MAGFVRRFGFVPGVETITLIEGVIIEDLPPPGAVTGAATGVVGIVGEFADMRYAVAVDATGVVTTKAQPFEATTARDLADKGGGFDATIGDTGNSGGNGFISLRNKRFSRLVVVPVNLASAGAGRLWRDLPTNLSATQPVPVVPLLGGAVEAGREFKSAANRVHLAQRGIFTALGHFKNATDGSVTSAGAAATQTFNSASGGFLTAYNTGPVKKGQLLVVGVIGAGGAQGANAATYRVTADAVSDTALIVEKLDGTNFDWTTGGTLAYRVHPETDGDTGGTAGVYSKLADTSGYTLPCRPLDATITAATTLSPSVVPPAGAATSWDSLSGLKLRSHVSAGFVYDSTVQAVNAPSHANIDALYSTAIDSLLGDAAPARDVNVVITARKSSTIRNKLKAHALAASQNGIGRMSILAPGLQTTSVASVIADADPGVGANRDERVMYSWPGSVVFVPEAVGAVLGTADGLTTTDGNLDVSGDAWLASVLSNLPPERNPGQSGEPVTTVLAPILSIQRGVPVLAMSDYIQLRAAGICGLRIDRSDGPVFQSGITTSLNSGQKNIARRRMADFIQDSVGSRLTSFSKQPLTTALQDSALGEVDAFMQELLSPDNPPAQRIVGYTLDDKSGNTADLLAKGVFVIIGRVRTLATADFIVFQTEIGEGVNLTRAN